MSEGNIPLWSPNPYLLIPIVFPTIISWFWLSVQNYRNIVPGSILHRQNQEGRGERVFIRKLACRWWSPCNLGTFGAGNVAQCQGHQGGIHSWRQEVYKTRYPSLLCVLEFRGQQTWNCDVRGQEKKGAHSKRANEWLLVCQALCWLDSTTHAEFPAHPTDSQNLLYWLSR